MTVNKTTKSKKKTTSTSSTSAAVATTSSAHSVTEETVKNVGSVSKSSSSSGIQISDVSHLPITTNVVTYTVTETLPQETGEKITTYTDSGSTSTEYRHFIAKESSSAQQQSSNISQISSVLNSSIQNLSKTVEDAPIEYIVHEPKEDRITCNKNDSGWNGKFIKEQKPVAAKRSKHISEHSTTASSHELSSSLTKASSSSRVIKIVDGKEIVLDEKHDEKCSTKTASSDEHLSTKVGTHVAPEIHYSQKVSDSITSYDTSKLELVQPKTENTKSAIEVHQVGQNQSFDSYVIKDGKSICDETRTDAFLEKERNAIKSDRITEQRRASSKDHQNLSGDAESADYGQATTVTTYYDSSGKILKSETNMENIPTSAKNINKSFIKNEKTQLCSDHVDENHHEMSTTSKTRNEHNTTDSRNFYGHGIDSASTTVKNVYDTKAVQNTIGVKGKILKDHVGDSTDLIYSNERNYGKSGWNGKFTYETPRKSTKSKTDNKINDKTATSTKTSTKKDSIKSNVDTKKTETNVRTKNVSDIKTINDTTFTKDMGKNVEIRSDMDILNKFSPVVNETDTSFRTNDEIKTKMSSSETKSIFNDASITKQTLAAKSEVGSTSVKTSDYSSSDATWTSFDKTKTNADVKISNVEDTTLKFEEIKTSSTSKFSSQDATVSGNIILDKNVSISGNNVTVTENIVDIKDIVSAFRNYVMYTVIFV